MSVIKLTSDSPQPAVVPGRVQLFGSDYNPFSQRVHMLLIARAVPHDVYDATPASKPAWLDGMQADRRQPVVRVDDGRVLNNEKDILDYLLDKFPGSGSDPALRERSMELLKKFQPVMDNFRSHLSDKDFKPSEQGREFFQAFEEELKKRGTTFLGGETPGTADFMIWPWFERFRVPFVLHGKDFNPPADRAPGKITAWREAMEKTEPVLKTKHTVEEHVEVFKNFQKK